MENIAAANCEAGAEGDWLDSINGIILCSQLDGDDEADNFMAQLFGHSLFPAGEFPHASDCSFSQDQLHEPNSGVLVADDGSLSHPFSEGCSSLSHQFIVSNDDLMKINDCQIMEGDEFLNLCDNVSNDSMTVNVNQGKLPMPMPELSEDDSFDCISQSNKRSRNQGQVQRSKRNTKMNKCCNHNNNGKDDDHNNNVVDAMLHNQGLNTEHDLNGLHELTQVSSSLGCLNSNRKTRASKGSATDPQSLYARKRRERINERLKILQNLVPNGTKVDISTMLEEAVQYVKFLQLQIKMLSSDELWMYAPIAYNGMGLGLLDLKNPTPNPQC